MFQVLNNRDESTCQAEGKTCDARVCRFGCWGPGNTKCVKCANYTYTRGVSEQLDDGTLLQSVRDALLPSDVLASRRRARATRVPRRDPSARRAQACALRGAHRTAAARQTGADVLRVRRGVRRRLHRTRASDVCRFHKCSGNANPTLNKWNQYQRTCLCTAACFVLYRAIENAMAPAATRGSIIALVSKNAPTASILTPTITANCVIPRVAWGQHSSAIKLFDCWIHLCTP